MKLTKEQEDILNGKEGEFKQGLMRLLVDWGTAMKAERMVPVTNVQPNNLNIPGSNLADTYKSLDDIMAGVLDQCSYCASKGHYPYQQLNCLDWIPKSRRTRKK
ncbi:MAG: aconitase X [[Clostridium] leptum]